MGLFKKTFSDAANELEKNLEDTKIEMRDNLEGMKRNAMAGFTNSASKSSDGDGAYVLRSGLELKSEVEPTPKNKPETEEKSISAPDNGIFSERLEALISAALQDGVLTDKERELLKRRVEKEGEDWDEVEMIIEARLKEKHSDTYLLASQFISIDNHKRSKAEELRQALINRNNSKEDYERYQNICKEYNDVKAEMEQCKLKMIQLGILDSSRGDIDYDALSRLIGPTSQLESKTSVTNYIKEVEKTQQQKIDNPNTPAVNDVNEVEEIQQQKIEKPISKVYVMTEEDKYATSIDIPEGVAIIPRRCFYYCSSMESVTLPSTIKQIGECAFLKCSALTSIDIPEGVTIIPDYCFNECSSLESITLPSTIKQIGEWAFSECSALTSIDIPEGVTVIPNQCFDKCKKLNSVTLPTTIKMIKDYAFDDCNKLKTISIPNGCEKLEELGYFNSSPKFFLPPSLCSIDVISTRNYELKIYCFAPQLEELEIFENCQELYVLPQYLDSYKSQAEAEEVEIDIYPMPEEFLYYYDN